ncbi:MAG TPA: ComF family protein [Vicinamibacteria bacterium]|nr:ComF family protein [Vicinamibacteria bacterium]
MKTTAAGLAWVLVDPLLAVVFPSHCPACGGGVAHPSRGPLCDACWQLLPRHGGPRCPCGVSLPPRAPGRCGRCRRGLSPFEAGASLGPYDGVLRTLLHELKYHGRRKVAARLAEALLTLPGVASVVEPGVVLVPVPLHPRRRRERGYNQSELLAQELAKRAGLEVAAPALVRRKDTAPQTGLRAASRRANVAGAFAVRKRARIVGRTVVLVDDVCTTGATARACAHALREAGVRGVRLLTAAHVA